MTDALKRFLQDVNLPGKVRERYKNDLENVMNDYGLSDDEKEAVRTKNIAELQKRISTSHTVADDPKNFINLTTN